MNGTRGRLVNNWDCINNFESFLSLWHCKFCWLKCLKRQALNNDFYKFHSSRTSHNLLFTPGLIKGKIFFFLISLVCTSKMSLHRKSQNTTPFWMKDTFFLSFRLRQRLGEWYSLFLLEKYKLLLQISSFFSLHTHCK
jgi:hypothetical protein